MDHPYKNRPERSFWKPAVAAQHFADMTDLWQPMPLTKSDKVATAGSCFAQHIGNNLAARGASFMDMEPAPPIFESVNEARKFGFGVFSCRYGNIYTSRQLLQLFDEAYGKRNSAPAVWERGGRFYDALRPGVDPVGMESAQAVIASRQTHLQRVRAMFETLDVFVFTMGLTEGWEDRLDGTMYPTAPGTIAGRYDPDRHVLHNLRYGEVIDDMRAFWRGLRSVNPQARMLLTISPVPLMATATDDHVLVATTYSKSVLRAVAGDLARDEEAIHYFPSYEIIATHPTAGVFFDPDLRSVNAIGVSQVMSHFFSGHLAVEFSGGGAAPNAEVDLICDEEKISDR